MVRDKITKFGINPDELGIFSRPEYEVKYLTEINSQIQVVM